MTATQSLQTERTDNSYETFSVSPTKRAALVRFIEQALDICGCTAIRRSPDGEAPFRLTFVPPWGGRMGIVVYAFLANQRLTTNRPSDEHRFQLKYGSKDGRLHRIWQDPYGLYTTLLIGINPEQGFFIGADPVLNSPTRLFISKEFKQSNVDEVLGTGWAAWDRVQRSKTDAQESQSIETLVGARTDQFLKYVLFEREAWGEDQGHRHLIADQFSSKPLADVARSSAMLTGEAVSVNKRSLHSLEREFELTSPEILQLISGAPRLKMAVRGWVAEKHLGETLKTIPQVAAVNTIEEDGKPDFSVLLNGARRPVLVECKNVLRTTDKFGNARLDFQKTRASKTDPCSRYYSPTDFQLVAACLHAKTERWQFAGRLTSKMNPHRTCTGKLASNVVIDAAWVADFGELLLEATRAQR